MVLFHPLYISGDQLISTGQSAMVLNFGKSYKGVATRAYTCRLVNLKLMIGAELISRAHLFSVKHVFFLVFTAI